MSLTLTLSGKTSVLSANYFPPIVLSQPDDSTFFLGLVDFETFNSIPNVDDTNNRFMWTVPKTLVVPHKSYRIRELLRYVAVQFPIPIGGTPVFTFRAVQGAIDPIEREKSSTRTPITVQIKSSARLTLRRREASVNFWVLSQNG